MCGFAGIRSFRSTIREDVLRRMSDSLSHRGPDDEGIFLSKDGRVGLAHKRLSILDTSSMGRQPMSYEDSYIVYNGAVYNFEEIRSTLESTGIGFNSKSDTEVILKSLKILGLEAVRKFRGMFALALWDNAKEELILIRDRAGVKPLYYFFDGEVFLFASQPKAIIMHPSVGKNIDMDAMSLYLKLGYVPAPYSIYRGIKKLEPGHILILDSKGGLHKKQYWNAWELCKRGQELSRAGEQAETKEIIAQLEAILSECFNLRMVSDVPVGVFLSGGIDSSLLTSLLAPSCGRKLKTFTVGFEEEAYDEAGDARILADYLGTEHYQMRCTPRNAMDIIPILPDIYDEPFGDSSAIVTYLVSRFARDKVKVALSADGGDETFAGYKHYLHLGRLYRRFQHFPWLGRKVTVMAKNPLMIKGISLVFKNPELKIKKISELTDKSSSKTDFFLTARSIWTEREIENLLHYSSNSLLDFSTNLKSFEDSFNDFISFAQAADYSSYLPDDILTKVDRATMAVGLEGREPLLDHKILECAVLLPGEHKIGSNQGKIILRKILEKHAPSRLTDKPKHGFTVPLNRWLRNELKHLIHDHLDKRKIKNEGILDPVTVTSEIDSFLSRKTESASRLWLLIEFELWYEKWMR